MKFYHHTKAHTSGACLIHAVISNAVIALILPSTYKGFIDCARSVSTSGPCSCCFPCQGPPSLFHLEAPTSPDSFRSLLKCHLLTLFKNLPSFHSPQHISPSDDTLGCYLFTCCVICLLVLATCGPECSSLQFPDVSPAPRRVHLHLIVE